jgi:hypothetical protein
VPLVLEDEGTGVFGDPDWEDWNDAANTVPFPGWAQVSAGGTRSGTAGALTKGLKQALSQTEPDGIADYRWRDDQFCSGRIAGPLAAVVVTSTATKVVTGSLPTTTPADEFNGCLLRVIATGVGGPALGEYREIWDCYVSGSNYVLHVYDAFSAAPVAATRFAILKPPAFFEHDAYEYATNDVVKRRYPIDDVGNEDVVTPLFGASRPFAPAKATNLEDSLVPSWQIGWEPRWLLSGGAQWCGVLDVARDELVLTNGRSGLLAWDGRRLRRRGRPPACSCPS